MENITKGQALATEYCNKTMETMAIWAQANRAAVDAMVELSSASAREASRLYADLQQRALDAMREQQAVLTSWPDAWKQGASDPATWYQKAMNEGISQAQKAFRVAEEATRAFTRAAETLQATSEKTSKGLQQTFADAVTQTREIYSGS